MKRRIGLALAVLTVLSGTLSPEVLHAQRSRDRALASLGDLSKSFEALSRRVNPAVVQILASGYALRPVDLEGGVPLARRRVGGAGVIVDPAGYIVTNAHVVAGASRVQVRLPRPSDDGASPGVSILKRRGRVVGAQIVGIDRETDLAVLRVDGSDLPYLSLGDSDEVRKGQLVFAFGNPLGLENSVSMGVVSAVARQLRPEDPMIYIQTDAPINPGSSGGPLVNADGLLVGINTLILSQSGGSEGLGLAAPSNIVENVYRQIKSTGYVRRGVIGVHAQTITPTMAAGLDLPRDWGVVLGDVYPGSPAARAGLQVADVVLTLNNRVIENGRQFNVGLYNRPVGEVVNVEVARGPGTLSFKVSVIERPDDINRFSAMVTPKENLIPSLGILAIDLSPDVAALLPQLRVKQGVVVAASSPQVASGPVPLLPGDVIRSINRQPVTSLRGLRAALASRQVGDPVVLHVQRKLKLMFVAFELE